MVTAFIPDKRSNVYVRLEASVLSYIAEHLIASGSSTKNAPRPSPYTFVHAEVKWNSRRKRSYINYRDVDGIIHYQVAKLRPSAGDDDFDSSVREASEKLHEEYLKLHHPDGDDASVFDGGNDVAANANDAMDGADENDQDDAGEGSDCAEIAEEAEDADEAASDGDVEA